jgi:phosphoacetylglucosamine mutase
VSDRSKFVTINAETELSHPVGLQERINELVANYPMGRSFVRPSGTEDVVRVYAETSNQKDTNELAFKICGIVFDHYEGVGERPAQFL